MQDKSEEAVETITAECRKTFTVENGWELYPFKIGWYNGLVDAPFVLNYDKETLGILVISTPRMFENVFQPWLRNQFKQNNQSLDVLQAKIQDPLDQCLQAQFDVAIANLKNSSICTSEIVTIHYFEMHPNRRPKLLMNTAGHAAGAAYYHRPSECRDATMESNKKFLGLSLHPKYGGWFAFRGALIFPEIRASSLVKKEPVKLLKTDQEIAESLEKFNYHWQDWAFRDVVPAVEKYSEVQKEYFSTKPSERWKIIEKWLEN